MKKSRYKSIFHIYFIFILLLLFTLLAGLIILYKTIAIQRPDGNIEKSNWPSQFTEEFANEIIFVKDKPQVKQTGLEKLQKNQLWLQIIDENGVVVYSFQTPDNIAIHYSNSEVLDLYRTSTKTETSVFLDNVSYNNSDWIYMIHFPVNVTKITMYVNADGFTGGKTILFILILVMFLVIAVSSIIYGFWFAKRMASITYAVNDVANRRYHPISNHGTYQEVYQSLNLLDNEIKASDEMRKQTEQMREEWIANITHDLKTPLSPIKGYAELLAESETSISQDDMKRYAEIMLKNIVYADTLLNDLKLTYQLESGMLPVQRKEDNMVRFLKELIINILNNPEYETRMIRFHSTSDFIHMFFDSVLLTRAFNNLIINALVHGDNSTEIDITIKQDELIDQFTSHELNSGQVQIIIQDNGMGMTEEQLSKLFIRYYRGSNTQQNTSGTGLGLAIANQIIELHKGTISVESSKCNGTKFIIGFPIK